jgi:hypothetical protein
LRNYRYSERLQLLWGGTTIDSGDVQPETDPGTRLDDSSHLAMDVYDNAMLVMALDAYLGWVEQDSPEHAELSDWRQSVARSISTRLWDGEKFIPHLYFRESPFPETFDDRAIYYQGGTTVAIEAGLLNDADAVASLRRMIQNKLDADAFTVGLTIYPAYPKGFFANEGLREPHTYQNGGDWMWFGGRTVRPMVRYGLYEDTYRELSSMADLVICYDDFYASISTLWSSIMLAVTLNSASASMTTSAPP